MKEVALLVDTPNIGRGVLNAYGPEARPDYRALLTFATSFGTPVAAFAFVNDGVKLSFVQSLTRLGYAVIFSHARDVDQHLIAKAVGLHHRVSHLVMASGDGGFCPLVDLLSSRGILTFLVAVPSSCSAYLRGLTHAFMEMPVANRREVRVRGQTKQPHIEIPEPTVCQNLWVGEL